MRGGGWKRLARPVAALAVAAGVAGCSSPADKVSGNLKIAAENFELQREVIFYNTITGHYFATLRGRCSIEVETSKDRLDVTCKHAPKDFRNHYLGRAIGATYFVLQTEPANVSEYHTRITFNPQGFIPDIDFRGDTRELTHPTRPDMHGKEVPREARPIEKSEQSGANRVPLPVLSR